MIGKLSKQLWDARIPQCNGTSSYEHRRSHCMGCTDPDPTNVRESNMGPDQNCVAKCYFTTPWTLPSFQPRRPPGNEMQEFTGSMEQAAVCLRSVGQSSYQEFLVRRQKIVRKHPNRKTRDEWHCWRTWHLCNEKMFKFLIQVQQQLSLYSTSCLCDIGLGRRSETRLYSEGNDILSHIMYRVMTDLWQFKFTF